MSHLVSCISRLSLKSLSSVKSFNIASSGLKSFNNVRTIVTTLVTKTDRLYTNTHEWIVIKEKIGTVGISNHAQDALGDVVYAQLPDVGSIVNKEDEVGALESVKAASEIISPVSGKIIEKNESVENKPGLINTSCYDEGWLFKVELSNPDEIKNLKDEKSYEEFLKSDPH